jgi:hypothetical protein
MRIEHPYSQEFPPFCQAPSLRTNKPSNTHQLLIHHPFTGTFTGTKNITNRLIRRYINTALAHACD